MFKSDITARALIARVQTETDVALAIPNETWITWLNSLEQFLYSSIIQEQTAISLTFDDYLTSTYDDIKQARITLPFDASETLSVDCLPFVYRDIRAVYANNQQLIESTLESAPTPFNNSYFRGFKDGSEELCVNVDSDTDDTSIRVIFWLRPKLHTLDSDGNIDEEPVKIPIEFIEIAKSKLRAEAYMLENEFVPAQNWLSQYNTLIQTFEQWLAQTVPKFGLV